MLPSTSSGYNPGKKIRRICSALGALYSLKRIDLENVIYRDLGNGYDFEVSGLDNAKKAISATLHVWEQSPLHTLESIPFSGTVEALALLLETTAQKYLQNKD